jgi:hypothetical protein
MKKHLLLIVAALLVPAAGAFAADKTPEKGDSANTKTEHSTAGDYAGGKDWTLDEARKRAHENVQSSQERADKLDKMTEDEWKEHLKKRHAFMAKWEKMTPEEREAVKKERAERREERRQKKDENSSLSPSAGKTSADKQQ